VRAGAYPGTFDPPTIAHLAIAEAALSQGGLDRVDLVVSVAPLGKEPAVPRLADRLRVLEAVADSRPWLGVVLTEQRLIADLASGYDAVVLGADKWLQVIDATWYDSEGHRDRAVKGLPRVLVVPRPPYPLRAVPPEGPGPPGGVLVLSIHQSHGEVSSSAVRQGRGEWMAPEAAAFDAATGAWSDPDRYLRSSSGG
jgi:nicotinic acid mononucleotide adenylyltransferase